MQTEINYSHRLTEINWSNIKVVIFDFDGTVYDPVRLWKQALVLLCQRKLSFKHIRVFNTYLQMVEKHSGKSIEHHLDIYLQTAIHLNCEQKYIEQMVYESRVHLFSDMQQCLYPGFLYFFCELVNKNISRAIYSD